MRIFDTKVQEIKYKVLCEVSKQTWEGQDSFAVFNDIARVIVGKDEPTMRCCIYKERAIVAERIRIALGGKKENPNIVEVIDIACDECPEAGHVVTDLCRGCIAHRCQDTCKLGAISFDHHKAKIDKNKCVECGRCVSACPYNAINNFIRPCERACKAKAIHMGETGEATIDSDKCTSCGACVYKCPFGAAVDKSFIVEAINIIKESRKSPGFEVYAIMAPAVASQFKYASFGQIITAMKQVGFDVVMETALGADMVALKEAEELIKKGFLATSCCPAFVKYIENNYPGLVDKISENLSPMAQLGKYIKEQDPTAKVIFVGPCTAKKAEIKKENVKPYVDCVLTFEEIQALIDSMNIRIENLEESILDEASNFGREFAYSGGVANAVKEAIAELAEEEGEESEAAAFEFKPVACDGIDKCKSVLLQASKGLLPFNFIEGMACAEGCIGGAGCLTHGDKNKAAILNYSAKATSKRIKKEYK
ncbi:monomeric [FeFe] hydrogenase [Aminipila sp.]|uniref:monomeric [FeFe] hydrogenase n=1 Tax=Aminipila sp. TaxID=2060095 RepID=UPI00289D64EA|nr:monomeric [FeFe] hydrogenase [Aminipila sp.]